MPTPQTTRARHLRRHATDAETLLWRLLRNQSLGAKFRRQHPIGPYIADFAAPAHQLIIEADGHQHATSPTDPARTTYLTRAGWTLLRFWNTEILTNPTGTLQTIAATLAKTPLPPHR